MHRSLPRPVSALALALALGAGPLTAAQPTLASSKMTALKAQEPLRVNQAQAHILSLRSTTGLGSMDGFQPHHPFTSPDGRAVVRFHQTYQGIRVFGGEATVQVEPNGTMKAMTQGLKQGISLSGEPKLSSEQARAIALKQIKGTDKSAEPKVERIVFPSNLTGGLALRWDNVKQQDVIDTRMSVFTKAPMAPYIWAYEVEVQEPSSLVGGFKTSTYVIDGATGAVLRKSAGGMLPSSTTPAVANTKPTRQVLGTDTQVTGIGNSLYSGTVTLNTTQSGADGHYFLQDGTRGTMPNPALQTWSGVDSPGIAVTYDQMDAYGLVTQSIYTAGHLTNTWGDGLPFVDGILPLITDPNGYQILQGATSPTGETSAVDAMYGMANSWDFYGNLFARNGMDDLGTSVVAEVHPMSFDMNGNAYCGDTNSAYTAYRIILGDGTSADPVDPTGTLPKTEPDLVGAMMTRVMFNSSGLVGAGLTGPPYAQGVASGGWGESVSIWEGSSTFFGKMIQAYSTRALGQDLSVPEFSNPTALTNWQFGVRAGKGIPQAWLYKPSLDGHSVDAWFDGIEVINQQFAAGATIRALYFLAQGSSSLPSDDTYSRLLPGGMTGVGNDMATRIWYKAVTEYLQTGSNYADARDAAIAAAKELYSPDHVSDCAASIAVENAFAAVNIGDAPGQPKHVKVLFPNLHAAGSPIQNSEGLFQPDKFAKVQIFPTNTKVIATVDVQNTTNKAVTWSLGSPGDDMFGDWGWDQVGGVMQPDGTWLTPLTLNNGNGLWVIKATSKADPTQFAKGRMMTVDLDTDLDTEADAIDLGYTAMSWGLLSGSGSVSQTTYGQDPHVTSTVWPANYAMVPTDVDLFAFNEAFTNAFPAN